MLLKPILSKAHGNTVSFTSTGSSSSSDSGCSESSDAGSLPSPKVESNDDLNTSFGRIRLEDGAAVESDEEEESEESILLHRAINRARRAYSGS